MIKREIEIHYKLSPVAIQDFLFCKIFFQEGCHPEPLDEDMYKNNFYEPIVPDIYRDSSFLSLIIKSTRRLTDFKSSYQAGKPTQGRLNPRVF
jgi:hypothetical protein